MQWIAVLLVCGCVPYAVPPVTANVGGKVTDVRGSRMGLHVEVGADPLQLIAGQFHRSWDASLSATYDRMGTTDAWGAAAAVGPVLFPWDVNPDDYAANRLVPQLVGRWTTQERAAGLRVTLEHSVFTDTRGKNTHGDAGTFGEAGVGLYVESDVRKDELGSGWAVLFGVTLRVPFTIGIACCLH